MIRLVTEQDRARVLSLCRKDAWDGTELLAAYSARCADKGGVDWRRCDLWIGESETQKKNIQYLLCRVGGKLPPGRSAPLPHPLGGAARLFAAAAGGNTDCAGGSGGRILPAVLS